LRTNCKYYFPPYPRKIDDDFFLQKMNETLLQRYKQLVLEQQKDQVLLYKDGIILYDSGTAYVFDHSCQLTRTIQEIQKDTLYKRLHLGGIGIDHVSAEDFCDEETKLYYPPKCVNAWVFSAMKRFMCLAKRYKNAAAHIHVTHNGIVINIVATKPSPIMANIQYLRSEYYAKPNIITKNMLPLVHGHGCECSVCQHTLFTVQKYTTEQLDDEDTMCMSVWRAVNIAVTGRFIALQTNYDIVIKLTC